MLFTEAECRHFADIVQQAADARDAGIGRAAYLRYVGKRMARLQGGQAIEIRKLILGAIGAVHMSVLSPERLEAEAWTRCVSGPLGQPES